MSRTAIVTGASEGIGYGIVEGLLKAGYLVGMVGRRQQQLRAAADRADPTRANTLELPYDISTREGCVQAVADTLSHFGRIDVLCLNAGVYPGARLDEISEEHFRLMFDTNVLGQIYLIQAAESALTQSGSGRIVLTSSITGPLTGMPGYSVYGASKSAQLGLMRSLAIELADRGITVNAVLPGKIEVGRTGDQDPAYVEQALRGIPVGRLGSPADIAGAVGYFASPEASFVTGQALALDGGQTLPEVLSTGTENFAVKGD